MYIVIGFRLINQVESATRRTQCSGPEVLHGIDEVLEGSESAAKTVSSMDGDLSKVGEIAVFSELAKHGISSIVIRTQQGKTLQEDSTLDKIAFNGRTKGQCDKPRNTDSVATPNTKTRVRQGRPKLARSMEPASPPRRVSIVNIRRPPKPLRVHPHVAPGPRADRCRRICPGQPASLVQPTPARTKKFVPALFPRESLRTGFLQAKPASLSRRR